MSCFVYLCVSSGSDYAFSEITDNQISVETIKYLIAFYMRMI